MAGESLLIIDDDAFMRELLTESLSEAGYETSAAETGSEGLERLNHRPFQVALVDLSLPDMDGMEVVDRLATDSPDTQIIILTGYPSLETAVDALRGGSQDYLVKPFKVPEVLAAIGRALNHHHLQLEIKTLRQKVQTLEQEVEQLRGSGPVTPSARPRPAALPGAYGAAAFQPPSPESEPSPDETS